VAILLPDILRSTHANHDIERFEIRDRFGFVEFDSVNPETIFPKEVTKHTRVLYRDMLQHNHIHFSGRASWLDANLNAAAKITQR
jgi:hypothetical protein